MDSSEAKATREMDQPDNEADESKKVSIGKQTFERAISTERKRSARTVAAAAVGLIIVLTAIGFTFKDQLFATKTEVIESRTNTVTINESFDSEAIAREYTNAIVFIEVGYKLIHTTSGDDVYHEYMQIEDSQTGEQRLVALYMENEQGMIEPVLGLSRNVDVGAPIAAAGRIWFCSG